MVSVVMMGASGAVGGHAVDRLITSKQLQRLTLLNRRSVRSFSNPVVEQYVVDVLDPKSYERFLSGHDTAICTLGMGQPSKFTKEEFVRVDKDSVLDFARACKRAGVRHFELLSAVGVNSKSSVFYLRIKGELEDGLRAIGFTRLSLFQPSMILTPTNRYGIQQAITLAVWPHLDFLLQGSARKYRGIRVAALGASMANNVFTTGSGVELLHWDQFTALANLAS